MINLIDPLSDLYFSIIQNLFLLQILSRVGILKIFFPHFPLVRFVLVLGPLEFLLGLLDGHLLLRDILPDFFFTLVRLKHSVHALRKEGCPFDERVAQGLRFEGGGLGGLLLVLEEFLDVPDFCLELKKLLVRRSRAS